MNNNQSISLIDGAFTANEASEILNHLFNKKINFHDLKNFSSEIRFGKPDEVAQSRIPELKKSIETYSNLLRIAELNGVQVKLTSTISIEFVAENAEKTMEPSTDMSPTKSL
jgi:hypothetical protein